MVPCAVGKSARWRVEEEAEAAADPLGGMPAGLGPFLALGMAAGPGRTEAAA